MCVVPSREQCFYDSIQTRWAHNCCLNRKCKVDYWGIISSGKRFHSCSLYKITSSFGKYDKLYIVLCNWPNSSCSVIPWFYFIPIVCVRLANKEINSMCVVCKFFQEWIETDMWRESMLTVIFRPLFLFSFWRHCDKTEWGRLNDGMYFKADSSTKGYFCKSSLISKLSQ